MTAQANIPAKAGNANSRTSRSAPRATRAALVHQRPRHLDRLFHAYAGISPLAYVRKIRSASARELLRAPGASVERVAETVGFSSAEQLRRAFHQFENARPIDVRLGAAR